MSDPTECESYSLFYTHTLTHRHNASKFDPFFFLFSLFYSFYPLFVCLSSFIKQTYEIDSQNMRTRENEQIQKDIQNWASKNCCYFLWKMRSDRASKKMNAFLFRLTQNEWPRAIPFALAPFLFHRHISLCAFSLSFAWLATLWERPFNFNYMEKSINRLICCSFNEFAWWLHQRRVCVTVDKFIWFFFSVRLSNRSKCNAWPKARK